MEDSTNKVKDFIIKAGIRALWTMAESALAVIPTSAILMSDVNWKMVISASILGGILSLIKSIAVGLPELEDGGNK